MPMTPFELENAKFQYDDNWKETQDKIDQEVALRELEQEGDANYIKREELCQKKQKN
jgi:hypothetical protein